MELDLTCIKNTKKGVLFFITAITRASKTEVLDIQNGRCKIKVKSPPVDGEANKALSEAISKFFGLTKKSVSLENGHKGREKTFLLEGVNFDTVRDRMKTHLEERDKLRCH